jgi:hypothetical protein
VKQITVKSMPDLVKRLNALPNHYIYRGHADADWFLESSLERILSSCWSEEKAVKHEEYALKKFASKYHLYDRENSRPKSKLAWLATMQHYGVPTRLLDFSESPYIALYFALECYRPDSGASLALFAIDYAAIVHRSLNHVAKRDRNFSETQASLHGREDEVFERLDSAGYEVAWVAEPTQFNARLDRQVGSFLLSVRRGLRIAELLESPLYRRVNLVKFVIPRELYASAFALLRKMNITSKSLYGDLDGLARGIRMEMQVYSL